MTKAARNREYQRAWAAAHPEKVREYQKAYRAANVDKSRERLRAYRENHKEQVSKTRSSWQKDHTEQVRNAQREWRAANPERSRALGRAAGSKRRAAIKTATSEAPTAQQLSNILKNPCLYCGAVATHVDHYVPLSRGGAHTIANLVPACAPCNFSKGAKLHGTEWKGRTPRG